MSRIYFEEKGNGIPVVLIHGFCETHAVWEHLVNQLSGAYRVITIDLPGFGKSEPLPVLHSIDEAADRVLELLTDELKLGASVLLGHSLGGYVVLAMAEKKSDMFSAIGLVNSTAFADSRERKLNRNKMMEFVSRHGTDPFVRSFIPPLFYRRPNPHIDALLEHGTKIPPHTIVSYTKAMRDRPDRTHVLKTFSEPIFFLTGREDGLIPVTEVESQAALAKHPALHIFDHTGHMSFLEKEEETTRVILKFLAHIE